MRPPISVRVVREPQRACPDDVMGQPQGQPLDADNGAGMGVALSAAAQARVAGERPNQRWSRLAPKSAFSRTSASDAPSKVPTGLGPLRKST